MKPDDTLCYCFHITQRKIVNYIRIHCPRVPSEISECGGAGTGCGWCVPFLRRLFEAAESRRETVLEIESADYEREREKYLNTTCNSDQNGSDGRGNPD